MNKHHRRLLQAALISIERGRNKFVCIALEDGLPNDAPCDQLMACRELQKCIQAQLEDSRGTLESAGQALQGRRFDAYEMPVAFWQATRAAWIRWMQRQPNLLTMPLSYDSYLRGRISRTLNRKDAP